MIRLYLCFIVTLTALGLSLPDSCGIGFKQTDLKQTETVKPIALLLDLESSVINWKGTKITGKHEGTVQFQQGMMVLDGGKIASGEFVADMNSIAITDIPDHEVQAKRNLRNHLKSKDFFYTDKYPTAVFEISDVIIIENDSLRITGDLTIRDVTREIRIGAKKLSSKEDEEIAFETHFTIDRFDWNVAYQGSLWSRLSSILDNNLVHDEIELFIRLYFSHDQKTKTS